jgi:two-component system, NarL family, response regulator LiaR
MPIGVLLVDDSVSHRELLQILIDCEDEFEVVGIAEDGEAGVALAEQVQPDLIVSDIEMPRLDGVSATPLYRRAAPAAAVVLTSSLEKSEAERLAKRAGADLYIDKTTGVDTFVQLLKSALAERRARPEVIDLLDRVSDDMPSSTRRD